MNPACTLIADQPQCHWVCALPAEARALIDHYQLKRSSDWSVFPLYVNQANHMQLVVTGIGKLNAAIGLSYALHAAGSAPQAYACQVGIAGSNYWPVGEAVLAHQVIDAGSQQSYYPLLPKKHSLPTSTCVCYDEVQCTYNDPLLDMESAGFFHSASRLLTQDQVQLIKVVSDNQEEDQPAINPTTVREWISSQLSAITPIANQLIDQSAAMRDRLSVRPIHLPLLDRWHFTQYQTHELRQLCRRWSVLMADQPLMPVVESCDSAKSVLRLLHARLASVPAGFEVMP